MAVVAVRLCYGDLKSGKKGVLHVPHDGAPHAPLASVKELLVDDALAVENEAAEGFDIFGEHLRCSAKKKDQGELDFFLQWPKGLVCDIEGLLHSLRSTQLEMVAQRNSLIFLFFQNRGRRDKAFALI